MAFNKLFFWTFNCSTSVENENKHQYLLQLMIVDSKEGRHYPVVAMFEPCLTREGQWQRPRLEFTPACSRFYEDFRQFYQCLLRMVKKTVYTDVFSSQPLTSEQVDAWVQEHIGDDVEHCFPCECLNAIFDLFTEFLRLDKKLESICVCGEYRNGCCV